MICRTFCDATRDAITLAGARSRATRATDNGNSGFPQPTFFRVGRSPLHSGRLLELTMGLEGVRAERRSRRQAVKVLNGSVS